jgi:hypothetical protein
MKKYAIGLLLLTLFLLLAKPAQAQENDPVTQCARGVELFMAGEHEAAYPLLEAGFNGRATAIFSGPNDLDIVPLTRGLFPLSRINH